MSLRMSPLLRLSLGLVLLTISLLFAADAIFGLSTDHARPTLDARKNLVETLAIQFSTLASHTDFGSVESSMTEIVRRNPEVLSAALRGRDNDILAEAGDHRRHWRGAPALGSTPTHAQVPIFEGDRRWGTLEVRFTELSAGGLLGLWQNPMVRLLLFVALAGFGAYFLFMKRTLRHLDPSSVIPGRVQAALDVLAEGVVLIDADERIVLANAAFARVVGTSAHALLGRELSALGWARPDDVPGIVPDLSPWLATLAHGCARTAAPVSLAMQGRATRQFMVNAAPILDDAGHPRGAIVTFDDVSELERKRIELEETVAELRESQAEIRRQNEQLEILATRDPLTNCLNRRAFIDTLQKEFSRASRDGSSIACIMVDLDRFKSVNDRFGHLAGDDAIRFTAEILGSTLRSFDIVCRYGGEEFCAILPGADVTMAAKVAERVREAIEHSSAEALPELRGERLTASLGVSTLAAEIGDPMELVDRADRALYEAKVSGRNRVVHWQPEAAASAAAG